MEFATLKKINWLVVLMTAVIFVFYVFLKILFPNFNYVLNKIDLHGISIQSENLGIKNTLHVSPLFDYEYSSVELQLKARHDFSEIPQAVDVFKGYLVFAYTENEEIITSEKLQEILRGSESKPLLEGQLVSYDDAVHVLSDGKMRTFLAPEIFEKLGYDWDAVQEVGGDIFGEYEKGDDINFGDSHPSGTIFDVDGRLQIVLDGQRYRIADDVSREIFKEIHPILASNNNLTKVGQCVFSGSTTKKLSCSFVPNSPSSIEGNEYIFVFPGDLLQEVGTAKIAFKTLRGMDVIVAKKTLSRLKTTFGGRYFPELIN